MSEGFGGSDTTPGARPKRTRTLIVSVLIGVALVFAAVGFVVAHDLSTPTTTASDTTPTTPPGGTTIPGGATNPRGTRTRPAASGTVKSIDRGANSFVVTTATSSTVTVDVATSTTFASRGSAASSFAKLAVGQRVAVLGTTSGGVVHATSVIVVPAGGSGGRFPGGFGGALGTFGSVKSVDAAKNTFTLSSRSGTTVTVDVSATTKYTDLSGGAASFSSVTVGTRVAVTGTTTAGGTVDASGVAIIPAGGFGGGGFGGGGANGGGFSGGGTSGGASASS
jgi:hypothetical protein